MSLLPLLFQRKKSAVSYLNSPLHQGTRKRGAYELLETQRSLDSPESLGGGDYRER